MSIFILIGMSGAGKTTIGKKVAEETGLAFIDLDIEIEKKSGSISDIFSKFGENRFRELETRELEIAMEQENTIVSTGGGIIERSENKDLLKGGTVIYIDRKIEEIIRTLDVSNRPMVKNKPGMLNKLHARRASIYEEVMDYRICNNKEPDVCIRQISDVVRRESK